MATPRSRTKSVTVPGTADLNATSLPATVPVLLLPFRIETRFVTASAGTGRRPTAVTPDAPQTLFRQAPRNTELLLRVFPDTISTSSFEPELTTDEIAAGVVYWQALWDLGNPPPTDQARAVWKVLAGRFGATRAAWIAVTMTPTNIASRPAAASSLPAPSLPQPPVRDSSYERAPTTKATPDRWTVLLENEEASRQVQGNPITGDLAVGFTPKDGQLPDGLPVDAGMRWLVDFDAAEKVGMGIRIPLTTAEQAGGFRRIVIFGVRDATAAQTGDATLRALLDAHHYTDGFSLIPQGAPTNNTSDASSAYSTSDPDQAISFAVETGADLANDPTEDGNILAAGLGLPPQAFSHVRYADGHGEQSSAAMLTALWPATFGYFLDQMMSAQFGAEQQDAMRSFALATVRPRGPLPALRVGATPYGVLPTTWLRGVVDTSRGQKPLDSDLHFRVMLAQFGQLLLPTWLASTSAVPHVGASADPDSELAEILGMDASSLTYRGRRVIGDDLLWNMKTFLDQRNPTEEFWNEHLARGRALLDSLGLTGWDPRVIHTSMGRDSHPVPYASVHDAPLSETEPLAADAILDGKPVNYIQWLAHATMADVWSESYPGSKPTSILYRLLRQSMLREYVTLAGREQVKSGVLAASALREVELVGVHANSPTITPRAIMERPVSPGSSTTWARYLDTHQPPPTSPFVRLAQLRASLDQLALLSTAELDRLLGETLDSGSHRLDVWITAVGTSLLTAQRAAAPAAPPAGTAPGQKVSPTLHLGAFGWVENVRPAPAGQLVTGTESDAVNQLDRARAHLTPKVTAPSAAYEPPGESGGFILAPSMTQAAAAAVLRSGYLSHRGTSDEPLLAIDMSSERTRSALWLLSGVRQGLSLGALTGFECEQRLHEAGLDIYIQPFRDAFPLVGEELTHATANGAVIPPNQVVDGVKLRDAWQSGTIVVGTYWGIGLPTPGDPAQNTVVAILTQIDDLLGGLSDVSVAESVFQIMRGNYGRAGGILDAVSRGDHPPDPDIVTTPRAGIDVTHRLMLLFASAPPLPSAWSATTTSPRALVEPWLSNWVAGRMPDPATVRAAIGWTVGTNTGSAMVSLTDLDICPLDVLALANAADQPQRAELENRLILAAAPPPGADNITIIYSAANLPSGSVTFPDLLAAARTVQALLGSAKPLELASFALPDRAPTDGSVDLAELGARVSALVAAFDADLNLLSSALGNLTANPGSAAATSSLVAALVRVSGYGVPGAVPGPNATGDGLVGLAGRIGDQLRKRRSAVTATPTTLAAIAANAQSLLGANAMLLPHLTPPQLADVRAAFAQSTAMQSVDLQALRRWLLQLSHVREGARRLDLATSTTRLLGAPRPAMQLAQLPQAPGDRWLGLPLLPGTIPVSGRVAIEAMTVGDPTTSDVYAGLLIDEWLERIPSDAATAGLAFHFNEPNSRAPQALLLAICPDSRPTWDLGLLGHILDDTLDLAKVRGVDLTSLAEMGQILPALYVPFNLEGATPATTFEKEVLLDAGVISRRV